MSARRQVGANSSHEADESMEAYAGRLRACVDYLMRDALENEFVWTVAAIEEVARFIERDLIRLKSVK
tara:strand:- start:2849 stop:3052 length:204 start_codon:yes stop_codon:yes gene_type:complete